MNLATLDKRIALAAMRNEAAWRRARAQLDFAAFLLAEHASPDPAWEGALAAAQRAAGEMAGDAAGLVAAVESCLEPFKAVAKSYTVYLAGHAHIDMNWMWSWPETVAVTCDTFATVLDLMEAFPEFRFTQSQASVYEIVEQHHPELFARIAGRIKEGRWEVAASHWVEADKNLAGGEALCRHLLYTRAYMRARFGLATQDVPLDWSPDTFGHAATVPTYLARGGVKYLYLHRPGTWQQPVPEAFVWEGPDGARVLVRNDMRRAYNCVVEPNAILEAVRAFRRDTGLPFAMLVYGVGDHGGGPTRRDLLYRREMASWPVFPVLQPASARAFFDRFAAAGSALPVLRGELNAEFAGCYTTQALIKRANRHGEARLADAEFAALCDTCANGTSYPAERLAAQWRRVLFNQFHDILPGSCVHDARTYAHANFQEVAAATGTIETLALRRLAARVDTASIAGPGAAGEGADAVPPAFLGGGEGAGAGIRSAAGRLSDAHRHGDTAVRPFLIWNPAPVARREVVELTVWDREPPGAPVRFHDRCFEAIQAGGNVTPLQVADKGNEWGHRYQRLLAPVEVPALGHATLVVREATAAAGGGMPPGAWLTRRRHHCPYTTVERNDIGLENARLRVAFDTATGRLRSLYDKAGGVEMLDQAGAGAGFSYALERPHGMSAWNIDNAGPAVFATLVSVKHLHDGPHHASFEMVYTCGSGSVLTVVWSLDRDAPHLRLAAHLLWLERGTPQTGVPNLRFLLPLALAAPEATYEIPFGAVTRNRLPGEEVPALSWARVAGRLGAPGAEAGNAAGGCLVINDCKHGHALDGQTLAVNLVRAAYEPDPLPEIGEHRFALALRPFAGVLSADEATRAAQAFNRPLRAMGTGLHGGDLPASAAWIEVAGQGVVVSGLKRSEEGGATIVRLYNLTGQATTAHIKLGAFLARPRAACEMDLNEERGAALPVAPDGTVSVAVPAYGLVGVAME